MNLSELLNLGITARLDTVGGLLLDAPKGALSADLLDRIRRAKPGLLAELRAGRELCERGELGFICTNPAGKGDTLPDELHARRWRFHFHDRDPLAVVYGSPTSHAQALADEPTAIAAEPIPEPSIGTRRTPTASERAELLALLAVIYADDTDQDRQEATEAALSDPDGALLCYRAICLERGRVVAPPAPAPAATPAPPACRRCRHRAAPGRADPGYCDQRTELAPAYGTDHPLHQLPEDGGASCTRFEAWQ